MPTPIKVFLYAMLALANFFIFDTIINWLIEMFSESSISTETRIIIGLFSPALALGEIIGFQQLFSKGD